MLHDFEAPKLTPAFFRGTTPPNPTQTALAPGDQVFRHPSLQGTFFKLPYCLSTLSHLSIRLPTLQCTHLPIAHVCAFYTLL